MHGDLLCFCVTVHRKMRHARASRGHHCDVYHGWGESSFLCSPVVVSSHPSVRAPFIKTSLLWLHQELPWFNEKWAIQRAPLMNPRETISHEALFIGLSHHTVAIWTEHLWNSKPNLKSFVLIKCILKRKSYWWIKKLYTTSLINPFTYTLMPLSCPDTYLQTTEAVKKQLASWQSLPPILQLPKFSKCVHSSATW